MTDQPRVNPDADIAPKQPDVESFETIFDRVIGDLEISKREFFGSQRVIEDVNALGRLWAERKLIS